MWENMHEQDNADLGNTKPYQAYDRKDKKVFFRGSICFVFDGAKYETHRQNPVDEQPHAKPKGGG